MDITADTVARHILAANGVEGEPHAELLADTIREVEYHGVENVAADYGIVVAATTEPAPEWEIVRQEWQTACSHPYCTTFHRHLFNALYWEGGEHQEPVYSPVTDELTGYITTLRYHEVTRSEWIVLHHGERVGDPSDTRRGARAELERLQARRV